MLKNLHIPHNPPSVLNMGNAGDFMKDPGKVSCSSVQYHNTLFVAVPMAHFKKCTSTIAFLADISTSQKKQLAFCIKVI